MFIALVFSVFALTVAILNLLVYMLTFRQRKIEERLNFALGHSVQRSVMRDTVVRTRNVNKWIKYLSLPVTAVSTKYVDKLQMDLIKAGVPLKAEEMIGLNLVSLLVSIALGLLMLKQAAGVIVLGILGLLLPSLWLRILKARRIKKFENQLLDATLLLANALRAGHSFIQGLDLISRDMPLPLSGEFSKVSRETKIGLSLEGALENLTKRVESKDLEMVVTGVLIQRQVGGNLAEILDSIAHTIDKRIKNRAKIKALTAQTRASAWIISLMPFALSGFVFGTHPEFGRIMLVEPVGIMMLAGGGVMMVVGILVIRRVIRIDI